MAKKLTEILMEQGKLREEDLTKAQLHSQQNGMALQDSLIALGIVKEEDIVIAISKQLSVPYARDRKSVV